MLTRATEDQLEGDGLYLIVNSNKSKLFFEMMPISRSNMFINELYQAVDKANKSRVPDYSWISKYIYDCQDNSLKEEMNRSVVVSPEINSLPLLNNAKGSTPTAAKKTAAVKDQMLKNEDLYLCKTLRIFVGSWNVNSQSAPPDLIKWLSCDVDAPDIYAIGLQELDSSTETFVFNETPREEDWYHAVSKGLHNGAKYICVKHVRLVGMMLIVFIKDKLRRFVTGIDSDTVGTGVFGTMGNKGGVGVRFDFHNTSICFINSHLAAHADEIEKRNQDFWHIYSSMSFCSHHSPKSIKDHDQIYWMGDLNYRVAEIDSKFMKDCIENENYQSVLKYDQLIAQRHALAVFVGFKEGDITFKPTYKYDLGTDDWDSSDKQRAPAWCDRILWKGDSIEQTGYRSHPVFKISDHKPVSSLFNTKVSFLPSVFMPFLYPSIVWQN